MPQRATFIFDGPNFYKNLKNARIERGHLNLRRLAENLSMGRDIVSVSFFTSPVDQITDAENYRKQQKFFEALIRSGVTLKKGKLVKRTVRCVNCKASPIICNNCSAEQVVKVEKSVDVQLALEMVIGASNDSYDVCYLASCDSDIVPAIKFVRGTGKQVFMLLPRGAKGYAVSEACNTTIPITQETISAAQIE